jgi:signal peptidase I
MLKSYQKRILKISVQLLFVFLTFIFIYLKPFYIVKVVGDSMEPTLKRNSIVLVNTIDRNFSVGDIVIAEQEGSLIIKRIAYSEKQKFFCIDLGYRRYQPAPVIKNMEYQIEYLKKFDIKAYVYEVPPKQVFLLGDNEIESEDSRVFGSIPLQNIKAKIIYY